jgi:hypothetical protein
MEDNSLTNIPQKPDGKNRYTSIDQLRPKQLRFLKRYLELGNATTAYIEVYKLKHTTHATMMAWKLLQRLKDIKRLLYESQGLGDETIIKVLKDATKSEVATKFGVMADTANRLKAVEMIKKDLDPQGTNTGGSQLNVFVVNDPGKGKFEIIEGQTNEQ